MGTTPKVKSRETTYRIHIEQIFFDDEDESELIIRTGHPTEGGGDFDVEYEWVNDEPEWAEGKTFAEILEGSTETWYD
jgi:hypothetical protein